MIACNFQEYISGASGPNWVKIGFDKTANFQPPTSETHLYSKRKGSIVHVQQKQIFK